MNEKSNLQFPFSMAANEDFNGSLLLKNEGDIVPNRIQGGYNSTNDYLEIHFHLLLEDFMYPIRRDLHMLRHIQNNLTEGGKQVNIYCSCIVLNLIQQ